MGMKKKNTTVEKGIRLQDDLWLGQCGFFFVRLHLQWKERYPYMPIHTLDKGFAITTWSLQ